MRRREAEAAQSRLREVVGQWDHRCPSQRGQSLVEFTLLLPVLLLVCFGIIEFCLLSISSGAVDYATREAARAGSLWGAAASADQQVLQAIAAATSGGSSLLFSRILKVEIFHSDQNGTAPAQAIGCAPAPNEDVYDGQGNACGAALWPPSVRSATLTAPDYLGVRITWAYSWATSLLAAGGSTLTLTSVSVQALEPQSY